MRMTERINSLLNAQITHELKNQNSYLQIASYFENIQLKNLANYFYEQANGEYGHAKLIIDHINSRIGGMVFIDSVPQPTLDLSSFEAVASTYVTIEEGTTKSLEDIYKAIFESGSFIDIDFITSLLKEQVEEEDIASEFALKLKNVNDVVLFDATFKD